MPFRTTRALIRKLPGHIIKTVPVNDPTLTEGFHARSGVGKICKGKGYCSVLVVTDRTLLSLGFHKAVVDSIREAGISCEVFSDIDSEPTSDIVEAGRKAAEACGAECIVALGGGSVMDSCKMIAAGVRLEKINEHFLLLKFLFVPHKTLPIINIPSTAGTGAELTVGAMITDTVLHRKNFTVIVGLDITDVILDSEEVAADSLLRAVSQLVKSCGAADVKLEIPEGDYHKLCKKVCRDSINYSAPMTFNDKDIRKILWNIQNQG